MLERLLPLPAGGLRGDPRGDGRAARHDPAARPSAARVPAGARGGRDAARWRSGSAALREANPMLGTRGCRLGLLYPEIYEMQVRAIVRAAVAVERADRRAAARRDHAPARRLRRGAAPPAAPHARHGRGGAQSCRSESTTSSGTMIELPRACIRADEIAAGGGLLQLRHERPDPDDARLLAGRRRGQVPDPLPGRPHPRANPFETLDLLRGRRSDARSASRAPARPSPSSSSGSAVSTAATRARSRSATSSASTTSPARRTACRSRDWQLRRRRSPRPGSRPSQPAARGSSDNRNGPPHAPGADRTRL